MELLWLLISLGCRNLFPKGRKSMNSKVLLSWKSSEVDWICLKVWVSLPLVRREFHSEETSHYWSFSSLSDWRSHLLSFVSTFDLALFHSGPNGAIIHYSPDPDSCPNIDPSEIYLCDSGAQFTDSTTDVTRTWHFGKPTKEQIRAFTRVLQGHIAIDRLVFPNGTTGYIVDALARRALWEDGLDYRHGSE